MQLLITVTSQPLDNSVSFGHGQKKETSTYVERGEGSSLDSR
jgi:hypothetical protein